MSSRAVTSRTLICTLLLCCCLSARADVVYVVNGLDDRLTANVLSHVDTVQFGPRVRFRPRDEDKIIAQAIAGARAALRPFGYYSPDITVQVVRQQEYSAVMELTIDRGPPVRVASVDTRVIGPGAQEQQFQSWLRNWPLGEGAVLDQISWENQKQRSIEIASERGYLGARFSEHALKIDLEENLAHLVLVMDTGPRYVMGDVAFSDHGLKPGILEYVPRFEKGDYYTARLVSRLRTDLWRTGYFDDITVRETRRSELDPPAVDFAVNARTETRNHYNGAIGWGDETGLRLLAGYSRTPMSSRGDRLDLGVGYQKLDDQFTLRGRYLKPLRKRARQWWDAELTLRYENQDLEVKRDEEDEDFTKIANGDLAERHLKFGRLKLKNRKEGNAQRFTTPFVQYLNSDGKYNVSESLFVPAPLQDNPDFNERIRGIDNTISIGFDYELVDVHGRGFETTGHRDRAWVFHSNNAFGSTVEFTQLYASTRRSYLVSENFKVHVRAEAGYTDAGIDEFSLSIDDDPLVLSLTKLPNFYRFKAGGSMSVRGYGFEQLSNNDIGSNNIATASAEAEYRFLPAWSAAAFVDIGNAFNEWDDPDLKRGIGFGLRWFSFIGEVRIDIAQAVDFEGKPWQWHFTIGTPLL